MTPPIADMTGKVCIVTGANAGIGKQIATQLHGAGAHVIMACRSIERGQAALDDIAGGGDALRLELREMDASSQASIRAFATAIDRDHERIDALVNNAGIYPAAREIGVDGIEMTWATNVMGYFVLTNLLTEVLKRSAPSRIVNVASTAAGGLELDDLQWERRAFGGVKAYKQSKQANRMLAWVRAEHLAGTGVTINVAHPGGVRTSIARHQKGAWGVLMAIVFKLAPRSAATGADTPAWLASDPSLDGVSGRFYFNRKERECEFRDMDACRALWAACEAMVTDG